MIVAVTSKLSFFPWTTLKYLIFLADHLTMFMPVDPLKYFAVVIHRTIDAEDKNKEVGTVLNLSHMHRGNSV